MNQKKLFDAFHEPLCDVPRATDPNVRDEDRTRLRGQNAAILARLRYGPATNAQLAGLSLKYTARISDLRAAGYTVVCDRQPGGVCIYRLEE